MSARDMLDALLDEIARRQGLAAIVGHRVVRVYKRKGGPVALASLRPVGGGRRVVYTYIIGLVRSPAYQPGDVSSFVSDIDTALTTAGATCGR